MSQNELRWLHSHGAGHIRIYLPNWGFVENKNCNPSQLPRLASWKYTKDCWIDSVFLLPAIFYATKTCTKLTKVLPGAVASVPHLTLHAHEGETPGDFGWPKRDQTWGGPWGFLVGFLEPPRFPKFPKNHINKSCLKAKSFMKPDSKSLTKTKTNRNEHVSIDPARPGSQSDYPGSEFLTKRHGDQDLPLKTAWFLRDFSVVSFFLSLLMSNSTKSRLSSCYDVKLWKLQVEYFPSDHHADSVGGWYPITSKKGLPR